MSAAIDMAELTDYVPVVEAPAPAPLDADPVRAAWLSRREAGFGASEIATVLVALGMRHEDILASYQKPEAKLIKIRLDKRATAIAVPRIILRKAGLRAPLKASEQMRLGIEREPELVRQWVTRVRRGTAGAAARVLDPDSIVYWPDMARMMRLAGLPDPSPQADGEEPRLMCSPDMTARDLFGDLRAWDGKCSFKAYQRRHGREPECQRIQVNAQMAVLGATGGGVVEGEGWCNTFFDGPDGPTGNVVPWPVERDDELIAELRKAARLGWEWVCEIREEAKEEA